jgi:hypothetical protein
MTYYEVNNADNITGNFMPLFHSYTKRPDAKLTQDKAHSLVSGTKKKTEWERKLKRGVVKREGKFSTKGV